MFTIKPAEEPIAEELARREGLSMPVSAMVLTVDGEETGYALLRVENSEAELLCFRYPEAVWGEWLVRAALNYAANHGALTACCHLPAYEALLDGLKFEKSEDGYRQFIPDFFNRPCSGC